MPDNTQNHFWLLWQHTSNILEKNFDAILVKEKGLSYQQFQVLLALMQNGENTVPTSTVLARQLDRNPNTLSTILDRMEKGGLVKKIRDQADRRVVRIEVTEKGKQQLIEGIDTGRKIIKVITSVFSEEELKTFNELLEKFEKTTKEKLTPRKVPREEKVYDI